MKTNILKGIGGLLAAALIAFALWRGMDAIKGRGKAVEPPSAAAKSAVAPAAKPALATSLGAAPATTGAKPGEWTMDIDAAKALAAETGRPLLLNFTGSDWCGWCRLMNRQVFSQEAWQTYAKDRLVLVWIDFPRDKSLVPEAFAERNTKLSQEFEVGGFPTYILLDPDGQTRLGRTGATRDATPASFIATLEDALLISDKSVAALKEKMTDEQKAELDAAQEARTLTRQKLEDWVRTNPEQTDENIALFQGMQEENKQADDAFLQLLKAVK